MNKKIRRATAKRAGGSCEACGSWIGEDGEAGHYDHFRGRANDESLESGWLLCPPCDHERTTNAPSASHWSLRFLLHAFEHGYIEEAHRAAVRLSVLEAKGMAL